MQIRNVTAGTYTLILGEDILAMNTAKIYLQCETSGGAINILLPQITNPNGTSLQNWWFNVFINDVDGNASVNNITITPHPDDIINGSASQVVLSTNGVTSSVQVVGVNAWELNAGSSSASSSSGFAVEIINPSTLTYGTTITGGRAPYTYQWIIKSRTTQMTISLTSGSLNVIAPSYSGSTTGSTVLLTTPTPNSQLFVGQLAVKVTDANGSVAYGYWQLFYAILN